ncbi:S49 family peptidase [Gimesia aquarii]|uniref:Signal peptide peptidase SppA n=1 Tax=Gimesia aquarii TaxID=2527964 RepID=A0A517VRA2_9PLAN|nr:S49 family peptidase [Gimesia aquarii]QDT95545.1 Putative signal peptide peptidase SppA [Gimesia aquarii]
MDVSFLSGDLMILPDALEETAMYYRQMMSEKAFFDDDEDEQEFDEVNLEDCKIIENVAIVPLHGVIVRYPNWMTRWYGATSSDEFATKIEVLSQRSGIDEIIMDVDTPGGVNAGLDEAAKRINAVRKNISIRSVCNEMMASAGVYLGSCADEIVITRNGLIGSIGVIQERFDWSKYEAETGRVTKIIASGKFKKTFHPSVPFNGDYQEHLQNRSDRLYSIFVEVVADNRKTSVDDVLTNMADAKIFTGQEAVDMGLADRVGTLKQLVAELTGPNNHSFNHGDDDDGQEYARYIESRS